MIETQEQLAALPTGSIIRCEIEEYMGVYELTNQLSCCGGWHDFITLDDGEIEPVDDYTPELPAEVIS